MDAGFNDDLVIDFGTKYIKFGCSNESKPRGFIESNSLKNLHEIITQKCCILNKKSIIFIENPGLSIKQKSEIIKEFASFKIRWIPSSISSLISVGSSVGLVVDIGYQCTTAVPVYDYTPLMHYYTAVDVGMESVKKELFKVLPNTCNIDDLLVQMVSAEPLTCNSPLVIPTSTIGQTIKCPIDIRLELVQNIHLIGGGAMIPGIKTQLLRSLLEACDLPEYNHIKRLVQKTSYIPSPFLPIISAWIGGSIIGYSKLQYGIETADDEVVPDWTTNHLEMHLERTRLLN